MFLHEAIQVAVDAHGSARDVEGHLVIRHPLRVMEALRTKGESAMVVGVLHDVVEDTTTELHELPGGSWELIPVGGSGFGPILTITQGRALDAITRRLDPAYKGGKEPYLDVYIERVAKDPLARAVKTADLMDNLFIRGDLLLQPRRSDLKKRYESALARLGDKTR